MIKKPRCSEVCWHPKEKSKTRPERSSNLKSKRNARKCKKNLTWKRYKRVANLKTKKHQMREEAGYQIKYLLFFFFKSMVVNNNTQFNHPTTHPPRHTHIHTHFLYFLHLCGSTFRNRKKRLKKLYTGSYRKTPAGCSGVFFWLLRIISFSRMLAKRNENDETSSIYIYRTLKLNKRWSIVSYT